MSRRILSISNNPGLLLTRNDMLAVAGYSVASPRHPEDAHLLMESEPFDAVLIGDSVTPPARARIVTELRALRPQTPVLYVFANRERATEPAADQCVDVTGDPDGLLKALEMHIGGKLRRAA